LFLLYNEGFGSLSVGFRKVMPVVDYLVINRLSKQFSAHGQAACKDISFAVGERQFVALIGPSGCGKSTLLHIASGLSRPSSGSVLFKGKEVTAPHPDMMYIFQQYNKSIFPWKSVIDNVCLGVKYRLRLPRQEIEKLGREQLKLVGLDRYATYLPYQLSGGMQQRVAIARALARRPQMLLMDEPFSAIDAMMRVELQDLLLWLWQQIGLTILFVTHDLDEALYLAQRVVVMSASPGTVAKIVEVPIPYPRSQVGTRREPVYLELRAELYRLMVEQVVAGRTEGS
jgi:NitT/TauT family transport system ATP-binding protein